ncbi:MAG: SH3 domain-containing protein [Acetivibrionales bacterium]
MHRRKKLLFSVLLVIIVLLLSGFAVYAEGEKEGIVTAGSLNMREKPDITSSILTSIPADEKVAILFQTGDWYKVRYQDAEGWVYKQYISTFGESVNLGSINANDVNIRMQPSLSAKVSDRLNAGEKVRVWDRTGDWYKISYKDKEGWVHKDFLYVIGEAVAIGTVNASDVNVRKEPSLNSEVITRLPVNKSVSVYGKSGEWYIIETDNKEFGWIHRQYITLDRSVASRGNGEEFILREVELQGAGTVQQKLIEFASKYQGVKYVWGGESPSGFDCSGFVLYVFKEFGVSLPHNADLQSKKGTWIKREDLRPGDAVFFDTNGGNNDISHVGIYIGNGKFIHASSSRNGRYVKISDLSGYYSQAYMTARRYID